MSTIAERFTALLEKYGSLRTPGLSEKLESEIEHVRARDRNPRLLKVGQKAPFFALTDQRGNIVRSADILARGPLIVSFFRGTSCPNCNEEIAALADAYPQIREAGAELVAVTLQSAANARAYRQEHAVPFPILVDADFSVEVSFGVAHNVPIPVRFVIAMDGTIIDVDFDAAAYPSEDAVMNAIASLEAGSSSGLPEQGHEGDARRRRFGDFLRRCRRAIPVNAKAVGRFRRLPNRVGKVVSQEEFAEAIGVSRCWYQLVESGRQVQPSATLLDRICDVLMLHERQRLTLFALGLPAVLRRAINLRRISVLDASARSRWSQEELAG